MMRLDRTATLYLINPLQRRADFRSAARIPILMYHSIAEDTGGAIHPYYQTVTSPGVFAEQIRFLRDSGYTTVDLRKAMELLDSPDWSEKRKYVVITFDDGFQNFYTDAFPVLNKYGATATMFLPTSFIGDRPLQFMGQDCLTWGMVVELMKANITFGSHTVTHRPLWNLSLSELEHEISQSKETIEDKTGHQIDTFAYPFAFPETNLRFKRQVREILLKHGYQYAVSTVIGTAKRSDDRFVLKRLPVNSWDDSKLLRAKVEGGYDWLHLCQFAAKVLKNGAGQP